MNISGLCTKTDAWCDLKSNCVGVVVRVTEIREHLELFHSSRRTAQTNLGRITATSTARNSVGLKFSSLPRPSADVSGEARLPHNQRGEVAAKASLRGFCTLLYGLESYLRLFICAHVTTASQKN